MPTSDGLPEAVAEVQEARHQVVQANHRLIDAKNKLWRIQVQRYEARLERFQAEHPGPVDSELWWRQVRPPCEDCRQEIVDPFHPRVHDMIGRAGELIMLCCGRHDHW